MKAICRGQQARQGQRPEVAAPAPAPAAAAAAAVRARAPAVGRRQIMGWLCMLRGKCGGRNNRTDDTVQLKNGPSGNDP